MITEFGHLALILAFCVALVQATVPMLGASRKNPGWMAVGRNTALVQFALVAVAMAALMHAYITSDFSVINVVQNSHTDKPLLYKVTGVWGKLTKAPCCCGFSCSACVALPSRCFPATCRLT